MVLPSSETTTTNSLIARRCFAMRIRRTNVLKITDPSREGQPRKAALVMGVHNWRSIAWSVTKNLINSGYDVIITYANKEQEEEVAKMSTEYIGEIEKRNEGIPDDPGELIRDRIEKELNMPPRPLIQQDCKLAGLQCNVESEIPSLFKERIPEVLEQFGVEKLSCIVHSIAFADFSKPNSFLRIKSVDGPHRPLLITSRKAYLTAQHISAYSFLETAREAIENNLLIENGSLTAISYLGAVRAVPEYAAMGPAKAALESIVRGLALELGPAGYRCNAVSPGPVRTVSAMGIPSFRRLRKHMNKFAPLRRSCEMEEIAETVKWLSTTATGITGQTIYVDAGYSSVVPVSKPNDD